MHKSAPVTAPIASQTTSFKPKDGNSVSRRPDSIGPSLISTLKTLGKNAELREHVENQLIANPKLVEFQNKLVSMLESRFGSLENAVRPGNIEQFEAHVETLLNKYPDARLILESVNNMAIKALHSGEIAESNILSFERPVEDEVRTGQRQLAAA